jgi:hypothetical protein
MASPHRGKQRTPEPPAARVRISIDDRSHHAHRPTREEKNRAELFDSLESLKRDLSPDAGFTVRVWRYSNAYKGDEYLGSMALADFTLDAVAERYGGGAYSWRAVHPSGQYVKADPATHGTQRFNIAGPARYTDGSGGPAPASTPGGEMRFVLDLLKDLALDRTKEKGGGIGDVAVQMATAMATIQATTMQTMLTAMKGTGGGTTADLMENVTAVLELADKLKGDGGGGSDPLLAGMLATAARALEHVADSQRASGRAPLAHHAALALMAGAPPAAQPVAPQEDAEQMTPAPAVLAPLAPYIVQLVKLAERDRDPELYADVLIDQLSDHPLILGYLDGRRTPGDRAALQSQIAAAFPATQPHAAWFAELWTALWAALDAEPDNGERAAGSTPDQPPPARE